MKKIDVTVNKDANNLVEALGITEEQFEAVNDFLEAQVEAHKDIDYVNLNQLMSEVVDKLDSRLIVFLAATSIKEGIIDCLQPSNNPLEALMAMMGQGDSEEETEGTPQA